MFLLLVLSRQGKNGKKILERMNKKRNHLLSFALFSELFHNFVAFFSQKEQKSTLQHLKHS